MKRSKSGSWILLVIAGVLATACEGPPGADGRDGVDGVDGVDGTNGTNGTNGVDGTDGIDGTNGTNGVNGMNGAAGTSGANGMDGADAVLPPRELDATLPWYGTVRDEVNALLDALGNTSTGYDAANKPIAIFDWDNTVIKNDIGDATTFFMLNNDLVLEPAAWADTSEHLVAAALTSLDTYCPLTTPGAALDTTSDPDGLACADAILCVYYDGAIFDGNACAGDAFALQAPATSSTIEPAYAWTVSLQAGRTPGDMRAIAAQAIEHVGFTPLGETQAVGTGVYPRFVRIYEQSKDLIGTMQARGFDVWVVSASSQHIVEPFARRVGVAGDHVIGVRAVVDNAGLLTHDFQGCGDHVDGNQSVITYKDGKRCWINKIIAASSYQGDASDLTRASPIAFGAGDSDTDLSFLKDASDLRLAINRNKTELMCNAYNNADGKWLVQPMFIQPKGQRTSGYSCSTYGIADQEDTVYGYDW